MRGRNPYIGVLNSSSPVSTIPPSGTPGMPVDPTSSTTIGVAPKPWYAPAPIWVVAMAGLIVAPLPGQPEGTDKAPTRFALPISAAARPGRPAEAVSAPPRPAAAFAAPAAAPLAALFGAKATALSMNVVGLSIALVVNALEMPATVASSTKVPKSDPLLPSRKFITPASPVVEVFVFGASPRNAARLEIGDVDAVEVLVACAAAVAWLATPSALVVDRGAVNGSNRVAALEALA